MNYVGRSTRVAILFMEDGKETRDSTKGSVGRREDVKSATERRRARSLGQEKRSRVKEGTRMRNRWKDAGGALEKRRSEGTFRCLHGKVQRVVESLGVVSQGECRAMLRSSQGSGEDPLLRRFRARSGAAWSSA